MAHRDDTYQEGFEAQNPDQYDRDLNPDGLAGRNVGTQGQHSAKGPTKTAYDLKGIHHRLSSWNDADLRQVPVMPVGARLEQGATYIDLHSSDPSEFTAMGNEETGEDNAYVPKTEVPYALWNRLIGVDNPERLDAADEGTAPRG